MPPRDALHSPGEQHPPQWREDLNPNPTAGQNQGDPNSQTDRLRGTRTAYDDKDVHNRFSEITDLGLKDLPIVPEGERLQQGAVYLDLSEDQPREFKARGDMKAEGSHRFVPKDAVDYQLWNKLIGVDNPERLGESGGATG